MNPFAFARRLDKTVATTSVPQGLAVLLSFYLELVESEARKLVKSLETDFPNIE